MCYQTRNNQLCFQIFSAQQGPYSKPGRSTAAVGWSNLLLFVVDLMTKVRGYSGLYRIWLFQI